MLLALAMIPTLLLASHQLEKYPVRIIVVIRLIVLPT
jgi:hypothetical protein